MKKCKRPAPPEKMNEIKNGLEIKRWRKKVESKHKIQNMEARKPLPKNTETENDLGIKRTRNEIDYLYVKLKKYVKQWKVFRKTLTVNASILHIDLITIRVKPVLKESNSLLFASFIFTL